MEPFIVLVIGLSVGIGAGALSSVMGWVRSNDPFDAKKFASGVITGIIGGVVVVMANTQGLQTAATDLSALLIQLVIIVLAILGVDYARTTVTNAIRKVKLQEVKTQ